MFAERFDSLMNIAEVSNSLLGRDANINPSYIGRLRSGARQLPKKQNYLTAICRYLAGHIKKDYQQKALQELTGISPAALNSTDSMASYLEQWLLDRESDTSAATGRFISGFSRLSAGPLTPSSHTAAGRACPEYSTCLYGNAGKRRAVEQFFLMILREQTPQTLLLFSDEDMAWLYEDVAFAARWAELFTQVLSKGNRVKIIHTIYRDMNEMLEAVTKWIPIYMTGMIEPYYYPRLRDGLFQRTLFIAPNTAAVISSSVQKDTNGMLNLFLTDKAAVNALVLEYEHYFSLCRPLMRIFTERNQDLFRQSFMSLSDTEGDTCLCCAMPPLFSMPEELMLELSKRSGNEALPALWKQGLSSFLEHIRENTLSLILADPKSINGRPGIVHSPMAELFAVRDLTYTYEQYLSHMKHLKKLERQHKNLRVRLRTNLPAGMLLYVKDDRGVIMAKADSPMAAFLINEPNMIHAFWDYLVNL